MTRVFVEYVVIALFIAVLGLAGYSAYLSQRLDAAQSRAQDSTAEAKGYKVYATGHKKVAEEKEKARVEVQEVLEQYPDWAEQRVPDELADKLRDPNSK